MEGLQTCGLGKQILPSPGRSSTLIDRRGWIRSVADCGGKMGASGCRCGEGVKRVWEECEKGGKLPALSHLRGQSRALKARMAPQMLPGPAAGRRLASGPICAEGEGTVRWWCCSPLREDDGVVQSVSISSIDTCAGGGVSVVAFVARCAR